MSSLTGVIFSQTFVERDKNVTKNALVEELVANV